ncbi:1,3-beta-glucanase [Mycobacterium intermedium]|uniref:1,3-beta-glucanase n=1 Tax=Mycobacterium intermedium TaxID=28445 RepID=A0A1E3S8J9_MYCIE|nr:glycoside hydrolase family 16 protein [Mycobacterium intermedium]MCV6964981.1 glycoside hydrolase family 16 protein [Mycobacterium intermedium]ODQ98476.1 1,3-beta-glucanase [Mycobacterium intermedium]OPE48849.1 1,3-beta-glucanase [Mycobacterium intermedium]ORA96495.1 1,3-beta-glucanase [Mycobacterium intermedium]
MDRRSMLLTTGLGMLAAAAAIRVPEAQAHPSPPQAPSAGPSGPYLFHDEFDGPAGSGPDPSKWTVQTWQDDVFPPVDGIYRDDRRNVFQDGNSNLVLRATRELDGYYSGKLRGNWRGMINTTWEARIKLDCLSPGLWPAFWTVNEDPLPDGEVDIFEWYGNGEWAPGSTVHAASNGKTWEGKSIPGLVDENWHTWQMRWDEGGFKFFRDGAQYFSVPPKPIHVYGGAADDFRWPFNNPGYWMTPMFTLAVGGVGAGDPAGGSFPASMLIDYIRVW